MLSANQNTIGRIYYFALVAVVFTLPFSIQANSIAITLLVVSWLAEGNFRKKLNEIANNRLILGFLFFYLLHVIGLFYTENKQDAIFDLERKMTLFIFPLVLGTSTTFISRYQWENILKAFVFSCLIASLVFISYAVYQSSTKTNLPSLFSSENALSNIIQLPPLYFGMYLTFCLFVTLYFIIVHWNNYNPATKFFRVFLILYFGSILVLLNIRILFIAIISIFLIATTYFGAKNNNFQSLILALLLFAFAGFVLVNNSTFLKQRYYTLFSTPLKAPLDKTTQKLLKWKCSIEILKQYPLWGIGNGDVDDKIAACYHSVGLNKRFNSHNQYMQTWLGLGLLGLATLVWCLVTPLFQGLRHHHYLYTGFMLLFMLCCITESVLNRQKGVIFYTFFNSLFLFYFFKKNNLSGWSIPSKAPSQEKTQLLGDSN